MEAVNPCNEKEECFPSQGNVTRGQAVVRSPARRAPPAHTSYGPFFWLSSPRTSTQPAVWSPRVTTPARPWEAQLQTLALGSSTSDTAPSSPACAGLLPHCRGFLRLLPRGQGEKRGRVAQGDEAGRSFWLALSGSELQPLSQ